MNTTVQGETRFAQHQSHTAQSTTNLHQGQLPTRLKNAANLLFPTIDGKETSQPDLDANNNKALSQVICTGIVKDFMPYDGMYRVLIDNRTTEVLCADINGRGLPFAVGRAAAYPVNSRVVVFYKDVIGINFILGVIPDLASGARMFSASSSLHAYPNNMWGRIGVRKDAFPATYAQSFNRNYFGDGRPVDTTVLGDLSYSNFLGGLIQLNMWQNISRISVGCGIWMNLIDELMRVVAKNYQLWTPAGQINKYSTCGETYNYSGQALFDWEGLGMLAKPGSRNGDEWVDINTDRATDTKTLEDTVEPKDRNMSPFFRFEQFEGWFGHGGMRSVRSLPSRCPAIYAMNNALGDTSQLFRQSVNVSGAFSLQAAGGFSLERTINMPCYQNMHEPYEDGGDSTNKGYKYLGTHTTHEDHVKTLVINPEEKTVVPSTLIKALGVDDYYHREKYKSLYAFATHTRDYHRIDNQDAHKPELLDEYVQTLSDEQFMPDLASTEANAELFSDAKVTYVKRKTGIYATPDGGFLIRDAYGNEIRTGANGIEFNSISDITSIAHRRSVSMSGDDTIITANKSMDLTAVQNDMRLQAFRNMEITGAVSHRGRTVIENRGEKDWDVYVNKNTCGEDIKASGLYLLSKKASTIHYTNTIYTKCEKDAYYDYGKCWNYADETYEIKAKECAELLTGQKLAKNSDGGVVIKPNMTTCLTDMHIQKNCVVASDHLIKQELKVVGTIKGNSDISLSGSGCFARGVNPVCMEGIKSGAEAKRDTTQKHDQNFEQTNVTNADLMFDDEVQQKYESEQPGEQQTIKNTYFKGRTQKQYGSDNYFFVMPAYVNEIDSNKGNTIKLSDYYKALLNDGQNCGDGPFPGRIRWNQACCIVPKSRYEDGNPAYTAKEENSLYGITEIVGDQRIRPKHIDKRFFTSASYFMAPEAKKPEEVFSSVVVS